MSEITMKKEVTRPIGRPLPFHFRNGILSCGSLLTMLRNLKLEPSIAVFLYNSKKWYNYYGMLGLVFFEEGQDCGRTGLLPVNVLAASPWNFAFAFI